MRHLARSSLLIGTAILVAFGSTAGAMPVYLQLDSQFPSGHHPRAWLENRTKRVQFQRWMRIKTASPTGKGDVYGWLPEDHLITPLKLASEAALTEDTPARTESEMDALSGRILKKGTPVLLLDLKGSWARVQPLPATENRSSWVPTESLRALSQSQTQKAFVFNRATVFVLPGLHARRLGETPAGKIIQALSSRNGWVEIRFQGGSGYIRRSDVWTLEDLGEKGARPFLAQAPLRSAPLPYADLVTHLPRDSKLEILSAKVQRWGQVRVPETGELWWPIADDFEEEKGQGPGGIASAAHEKLLTRELFARKIFDMASSPAIPSLKFVSAQGVFRTIDGQEWSKIPLFKDENYPIAIASEGPVFVGPYVSEDQGETFQTWIRWDKLVATIKSRYVITPRGLQILEIKPEDANGRRITLKLNIGLEKPIRTVTEDQGLSWKAL